MAVNPNVNSLPHQLLEAIATSLRLDASTTQQLADALQTANTIGETTRATAQKVAEDSTQFVGHLVEPIAESPLIKFTSKVPGINWLTTALGQVDRGKATQDVEKLRLKYPLETPEQLANRIIADTSFQAGGIGLLTNLAPPLALTLFAVDIVAVTTLQAEMVYRIAAAYGFSLQDPARRGEVLAIWGLSLGGSGAIKTGMSVVELVPVVGALVGASSNATLVYSLGYVAREYYAAKQAASIH